MYTPALRGIRDYSALVRATMLPAKAANNDESHLKIFAGYFPAETSFFPETASFTPLLLFR